MKSVDSGKPLYITPHAKKWLLVELVLKIIFKKMKKERIDHAAISPTIKYTTA